MSLHSQTAAAVNDTQHCSSPEVKDINNFFYCMLFPAVWEKVIVCEREIGNYRCYKEISDKLDEMILLYK